MEIWQPNAKDGSAVLIFKESSDWGKVKATLGKSTNGHWEPLEASVAKGEPKHFAYMSTLLVCNDEAWQMLKVELKDEVEALPINVDGFLYYILNVINIVDCLDMDRSKFLRLPHLPSNSLWKDFS